MSRKKCIRKVWAKVNPLKHAIEGAALIPRAELDALLMRELASLDALTTGKGSLKEWDDMVAMNNLTQTLVSMDIGPEASKSACNAELALIAAAERFQRTGKMGLDGPGIQAIRDVIEYHDLQRSSISRSRYEEAIRLTIARVKSGCAIDLEKSLGKPATA